LAGILNNLAFNFQAEGDLTAARPLYVRALAICERGLDPEHLTASRVRRNMATLLLATGQPGEALGLGAAALAAQQKALGLDHAWTKDSARVTADALGRTEEAKALRERYGLTPPEKPQSS
jgi:tetratricopeptide (TPR) repeat protein